MSDYNIYINKLLESNSYKNLDNFFDVRDSKMPNKLYRFQPLCPDTNKYFKRLIDSICKNKLHLITRSALNDPFEMVSISACSDCNFNKSPREIQNFNQVLSLIPIACFTENLDNVLMWSHYANGHRGICLEYDTLNMEIPHKANILPVLYTDELPDITHLVYPNVLNHSFELLIYVLYFLLKLKIWRYEKEWRYIGINYSPSENLGVEINFYKPSKIIVGCKIQLDSKKKLIDLSKSANINISQMYVTIYGLKESFIN